MDILGNDIEVFIIACSGMLLLVILAVLGYRYYRGRRVCCYFGNAYNVNQRKSSLPLPVNPPLYKRGHKKVAVIPMLGVDQPKQKIELDFRNSPESSSPVIELDFNEVQQNRQGEPSTVIDNRSSVPGALIIASIATTARPRYLSDNSSAIYKPPATISPHHTNWLEGERTDANHGGATSGVASYERCEHETLGSEGALSLGNAWKAGARGGRSSVVKRDIASVPFGDAWPGSEKPLWKGNHSHSEKFRSCLPCPSTGAVGERKTAGQPESRSTFGTLPSLPRESINTATTLSQSASAISVSSGN